MCLNFCRRQTSARARNSFLARLSRSDNLCQTKHRLDAKFQRSRERERFLRIRARRNDDKQGHGLSANTERLFAQLSLLSAELAVSERMRSSIEFEKSLFQCWASHCRLWLGEMVVEMVLLWRSAGNRSSRWSRWCEQSVNFSSVTHSPFSKPTSDHLFLYLPCLPTHVPRGFSRQSFDLRSTSQSSRKIYLQCSSSSNETVFRNLMNIRRNTNTSPAGVASAFIFDLSYRWKTTSNSGSLAFQEAGSGGSRKM